MYSARSGKYYFQISVSNKVADLSFLTFNSRKNINDSAPLDKQNIVRIDIQTLYTVFHRGPWDKLSTILLTRMMNTHHADCCYLNLDHLNIYNLDRLINYYYYKEFVYNTFLALLKYIFMMKIHSNLFSYRS